jgi:dolichol-phosphate mannosyltransferase
LRFTHASDGRGEQGPDTLSSSGRILPEPVRPRRVSIVLATLNERENLAILLSEIATVLPEEPEIVIVDDGSVDGTRDLVRSMARRHSQIVYVFNDHPQTITRAHEQGIRASTAPLLIFMDSDLQHPPEVIPTMLERLDQGFDVVIASRYRPGGSTGTRSPARGLISRSAALLAKTWLRCVRHVSDPTSGFFGVRREALVPDNASPAGYYTLMFLLARMKRPRISEVPYTFRERATGQSKVLSGLSFLRVYATQLLEVKRLESRSVDR